MLKKAIIYVLFVVLSITNTISVLAANGQGAVNSRTDTVNMNDYSTNNWERFEFNYEFQSGADSKETFGVPTPTDTSVRNSETENVRRNKDAALLPPSYGVFSGEIPTNPSSPYHSNVTPDYALNTPSVTNTYSAYSEDTGLLNSTSTMQIASSENNTSNVSVNYVADNSGYYLTQSYLYDDGSIGTIKIPSLGLTTKVYEGETLDSMKKGVGHFEFTSAWDSNVGIAGHNRGSSAYLSGIWNLKNGAEITYTTKHGQRTYEVYSIEKISDTDYSKLGWSSENMLTLITCVENNSSMRWCVQAIEK